MMWLRLQAKLLPYKLAWLLVVSFSIVYTLRGMQAIFPGEELFLFRGNPVTETHLLGIALCLGQYTMLSISFNLLRSENKLRIPDKFMAVSGLAIGIVLTISNTTFAFKAINMAKDDNIVRIETLKAEVNTLDNLIAAKNAQISEYNEQLKLIPSAHSSNIRKMFEDIQGYIAPLRNEVLESQKQLYNKNAEIAKLEGLAQTNRNFSLSGADGSRFIAMVMAIALDPIAIMIMLSMQSLTAQYWKEVRQVKMAAPLKLKKVKNFVEDAVNKVTGYRPLDSGTPKSAKVQPIRPLQPVEVVDHVPKPEEQEVEELELMMPPRHP